MSNKYQNGKIYVIRCNISGKKYIGSTYQSLKKRLCRHRATYNHYKNGKFHYISVFDILEKGNFTIDLLEAFVCESKKQLHERERFWIEKEECINIKIPNRSTQEWRNENKEQLQEKQKHYYQENKEYIQEYNKEWRSKNKDHLNEYKKEYYEAKRDEISDRKKQPLECDCGSIIRTSYKTRHLRTKKHQEWVKQHEETNVL